MEKKNVENGGRGSENAGQRESGLWERDRRNWRGEGVGEAGGVTDDGD